MAVKVGQRRKKKKLFDLSFSEGDVDVSNIDVCTFHTL